MQTAQLDRGESYKRGARRGNIESWWMFMSWGSHFGCRLQQRLVLLRVFWGSIQFVFRGYLLAELVHWVRTMVPIGSVCRWDELIHLSSRYKCLYSVLQEYTPRDLKLNFSPTNQIRPQGQKYHTIQSHWTQRKNEPSYVRYFNSELEDHPKGWPT